MRKITSGQLSGALLSGLLLFIASPGPVFFAPAAWLALVPLLYALSRPDFKPRHAALLGGITGLAYYPLLLYWILIVLGRYGNLQLWGSLPALLLLGLYMSLYLAGFAALVRRLQNSFSLVWAAPTAWVALDYLRGLLFSGFPWFDLAYTQFETPLLLQIVDLTGHHGLTFLIVMTNCLVFHALTRSRHSAIANPRKGLAFGTAIALVALALSYNLIRYKQVEEHLATAETFGVAVIQGNISQGQKWLPHLQRETLNKYLSLSLQVLEEKQPELIVWPETAMPFYLAETHFLKDIVTLASANPQLTVLTGAPYREKEPAGGPTRYYNTAFFINGEGLRPERYDKRHLVPFGEYVPFKKFLTFLSPLVESVADFTPGVVRKPVACQNVRVGVLICFESIFPTLARQQVRNGAGLLVNLTNDAWYGRSSAPWQHLSMAVFRAVENRRSLARAANTGISCLIDPLGRVHSISPLFEDFTGYEDLPVTSISSVFTFYGGNFTGLLCLAVTAILTMLKPTKNKLM